MKRKVFLICVLLVISILVIGNYKYLKNEEPIQDIKESNIAIMVYDDESDSYVKQNSVPKGAKYSLNETLTKCEAGGKVTNYNKANGTLKYVLPQMDYCYVYFDVDNTPSYAIYSETDNSLIFYKNNDTVGEEYNGRLVTAKYDDIEDSVYTYDSNTATPSTPWYEYANVIKTVSVANEIMPLSLNFWFHNFFNVESINLEKINTQNAETMWATFNQAGRDNSNFTLNLGSNFDTTNVTLMKSMFQNTGKKNQNFQLDLGDKFDTSNVTDMSMLFNKTGESSTKFELDLGDKFDTSNATNMKQMFCYVGYANDSFTLDLGSKFNTSNVTNMQAMFASTGYSSTIFELDLGENFNTINVTNMAGMFQSAGYSSNIYNINLGSKFDTRNVVDMQTMFHSAGNSNPNFSLNLGGKFDTSKVTNMRAMFNGTGYSNPNFELNLSNFNILSSCNLTAIARHTASKIIFGEGWANATLVSGMFLCDVSKDTTIVNAPANIQSYHFAGDNRVVTFTTI